MRREDAIRRLQACLRLSKSANPHEAAAALRQAQKLQAEFDLEGYAELGEVSASDASTRSRGNDVRPYIGMLANMMAHHFGARAVQSTLAGKTLIRFFGVGPAAQIAAYGFTVLRRQVEAGMTAETRRVRKAANKKARQEAFAEGWITAVSIQLSLTCGAGLADERVDKFVLLATGINFDKRGIPEADVPAHTELASKKVTAADRARLAGFRAGRSASLHTGVAAPSRPSRQQLSLEFRA